MLRDVEEMFAEVRPRSAVASKSVAVVFARMNIKVTSKNCPLEGAFMIIITEYLT